MTRLASLAARLQAAPYTAASMGVLLVAAYLCLVNLDYAALWHDEAPAAFFGKTLLQQGRHHRLGRAQPRRWHEWPDAQRRVCAKCWPPLDVCAERSRVRGIRH